jgi:2-keto-4-pentenoate hydratase/2-oxohepta-3-ene-1,7-dioic acid hydratase in catechol pathway
LEEHSVARYVRYRSGAEIHYGELQGDRIIPLTGSFAAFEVAGRPSVSAGDVKLLAPTLPTKIVSVGPNYGTRIPGLRQPMFWVKPSTAVNDPEGVIELPAGHPAINHEVELAVVIGKRAKQVPLARAHEYIFGYTCMNDVTAGDFATPGAFMASHYFVDGKIFDGFAPLGPWIETELDTGNLRMECRVNGEVRQRDSTASRFFSPAELVAMLSEVLTLLPGDVISTGSPPGVQPIVDGDVVEVEIEGIGVLRNRARARAEPPGSTGSSE